MKNGIVDYILKHSEKRGKRLKYDFMPSLLEIIERPAHIGGTIIISTVFLLLIVAVVWAALSQMDVVVVASGTTLPEGNMCTVQSFSSGIIQCISIDEGVHVKKGDPLIQLDTEQIDLSIEDLNFRIGMENAKNDAYEWIYSGNAISDFNIWFFDEAYHQSIDAIFEEDNSFVNEKEILKATIEASTIELEILESTKKRYERYGYSKSEIEEQGLRIEQQKIANSQTELQMDELISKRAAHLLNMINETNESIRDLNVKLDAALLNKGYCTILAPVNGFVNRLEVNSEGQVVMNNQTLLTILPSDSPLELQCFVLSKDIADIFIGQEVKIKLDAYPYSDYGTIKGIVNYISPSSFNDEKSGNGYVVSVAFENTNSNIKIISGLGGTVEIQIGKRSILEYLIEPIVKGVNNSMKEK